MQTEFEIFDADGTWVVRAGGAVIGESANALELRREGAEATIFFPREDLGMAFLDPSQTKTRDPALGEARFFHVAAKSGPIRDAGWSFEAPNPAAERLAGRIAFDRDKVTLELL